MSEVELEVLEIVDRTRERNRNAWKYRNMDDEINRAYIDNSLEYVAIVKVLSGPAAGELAYVSIPVSRNIVEDAAIDLEAILKEEAKDSVIRLIESGLENGVAVLGYWSADDPR